MYNESSGEMYDAYETKKANDARKRRLLIRRIVTVSILVLILIYFIILLIDINRYKNGDDPLILLGVNTKEYDDGYVTTKMSIGWVFREYNRETIKDNEMVPIWSGIRMDNVLNRVNDPDLPEIETGYDIPSNPLYQEKINGVLFFYDNDKNLLDTYKCLLSENDCEISESVIYPTDSDKYTKYKMGITENRYVFITEYRNKDTEALEKVIYLYDINAKKIIAKYEDIRYSYVENSLGKLDNSRYIVKKNGKWGIDQVIKGKVSNAEDYTHDYITFDKDTKLYIMQDKDSYYVYNPNDKSSTIAINEVIDKVYLIHNHVLMKTKIEDKNKYNSYYYRLYNSEGVNILKEDTISYLEVYEKFVSYIKDSKLYIINYDGDRLINDDIPIYFNDYYPGFLASVVALKIEVNKDTLKIATPKSRDNTHYTDEYYYNMNDWSLIRKRTNVKETT